MSIRGLSAVRTIGLDAAATGSMSRTADVLRLTARAAVEAACIRAAAAA